MQGTNSKRCISLVIGPLLSFLSNIFLAEAPLSGDGLRAFAMLQCASCGFMVLVSREGDALVSKEGAPVMKEVEDKMVLMPSWLFLPFLLSVSLALFAQQYSLVYCVALLPWTHVSEIFCWYFVTSAVLSIIFEQKSCRLVSINVQHAVYLGCFVGLGAYQAWPGLQVAWRYLAIHAVAMAVVCLGFSRFGAYFPSMAQRKQTVAFVTRLVGGTLLAICACVVYWAGRLGLKRGTFPPKRHQLLHCVLSVAAVEACR